MGSIQKICYVDQPLVIVYFLIHPVKYHVFYGSRYPAKFIGVMNPFRAFGPMAVWVTTVKSELENTSVIHIMYSNLGTSYVKHIEKSWREKVHWNFTSYVVQWLAYLKTLIALEDI